MKEKLFNLLNKAENLEAREQILNTYLTLVDSIKQQAEDLSFIISVLLTRTDIYKDIISDLAKNQKETDSEEPYDGMARRGSDGSWEQYCASDGEWYVPMYQWYDEESEEWRSIREAYTEECDDYE